MRENEICQLDVNDIKQTRSGTWYIDVLAKPGTKRVKNFRANRRIPIHSELIKIGLIEFAKSQATEGPNGKLFPELKPSRDGYYNENVSKWANRTFLRAAGVKTPKKTFHSFRHTFKDALDRAETPFHISDAIGGWNTVVRGASVNYGNGPGVEDLSRYIEQIHYPNLDLRHLYSASASGPAQAPRNATWDHGATGETKALNLERKFDAPSHDHLSHDRAFHE